MALVSMTILLHGITDVFVRIISMVLNVSSITDLVKQILVEMLVNLKKRTTDDQSLHFIFEVYVQQYRIQHLLVHVKQVGQIFIVKLRSIIVQI